MSDFNQTIPIKSLQGGTGSVGTAAAALVDVSDKVAHKGVRIKCTHASQFLYVLDTRVSATLGYRLGTGEEIFLEIERPDQLQVVGSGASTTYTWIAH